MRNSLSVLLPLLLVSSLAFSQVSGYKGKKFILKTDLTTPILKDDGFDVELEFAFAWNMSISVGYNSFDKEFGETNSYDYGSEFTGEGSIQSQNVYLQIRSYLFNSAYIAPRGTYAYAQVFQGFGKATGMGILGRVEAEFYQGQFKDIIGEYNLDNVKFAGLEIGFGNQSIIKNILVIDYYAGINYSLTTAGDEHNESYRIVAEDTALHLFL